jgi:2-polyprenyl-6-methoxyphenol hydroxylase-like FAD-dependent oxidoreductase
MENALITGIYFRDPLETWGTDRVTLVGDAAHPAPPSAGQGAGMALEDAVMLAACLQRAGAGNERAALREYAFRRQPRSDWPSGHAMLASRSRSARSPTASTRSSCSISCRKPTARWRSSPPSRRRCKSLAGSSLARSSALDDAVAWAHHKN